jgi:hypothetical protein
MPHFDRELELLAGLLQDGDRLGVVDAHEAGVDERSRRANAVLVDAFVEELEVVAALGEHRAEHVLEQRSARWASVARSANAISGSIIQNSARCRLVLRVLGAEGRAEGVDLGQREAVGLDVQLARDGQVDSRPKKSC